MVVRGKGRERDKRSFPYRDACRRRFLFIFFSINSFLLLSFVRRTQQDRIFCVATAQPHTRGFRLLIRHRRVERIDEHEQTNVVGTYGITVLPALNSLRVQNELIKVVGTRVGVCRVRIITITRVRHWKKKKTQCAVAELSREKKKNNYSRKTVDAYVGSLVRISSVSRWPPRVVFLKLVFFFKYFKQRQCFFRVEFSYEYRSETAYVPVAMAIVVVILLDTYDTDPYVMETVAKSTFPSNRKHIEMFANFTRLACITDHNCLLFFFSILKTLKTRLRD